jgi:hypothetical protein
MSQCKSDNYNKIIDDNATNNKVLSNMDILEDIDTQWITTFEMNEKFNISDIEQIEIIICYLDSENNIYHIKKKKHSLQMSTLSQNELLYILKKYGKCGKKSHKLFSLLQSNPLFNETNMENLIDSIEFPEDNHSLNSQKSQFIKEIYSIVDLKWEPCSELFSDLNQLFIFYKQKTNSQNQTKKIKISPSSAHQNKRKLKKTKKHLHL